MMGWAWVQCVLWQVDVQQVMQALLRQGIHPRGLRRAGAQLWFSCRAGQYFQVANVVRQCGGHCRVQKKQGMYFRLRRLLRRSGLFWGLVGWSILVLASQQFIWDVQSIGLDPVETALVTELLRQQGLYPGKRPTEALLTQGETALIQAQIGFGWASLNFEKGRLVVETAPAEPVPPIAQTSPGDIRAKCAAEVVSVTVEAGTPLVQPGDQVVPGRPLIGAVRLGREDKPVPGRTAGSVRGKVIWETSVQQPLVQTSRVPTGEIRTWYGLEVFGYNITGAPPAWSGSETTRYAPLRVCGLPLPGMWTCKDRQMTAETELFFTETLARAKARSQCLARMQQQWGRAEITQQQESFSVEAGVLQYRWRAELVAEIGVQ